MSCYRLRKPCSIIGPLGWLWPKIKLTDRRLGKQDQALEKDRLNGLESISHSRTPFTVWPMKSFSNAVMFTRSNISLFVWLGAVHVMQSLCGSESLSLSMVLNTLFVIHSSLRFPKHIVTCFLHLLSQSKSLLNCLCISKANMSWNHQTKNKFLLYPLEFSVSSCLSSLASQHELSVHITFLLHSSTEVCLVLSSLWEILPWLAMR